MANTKISALTAATTPDGTEVAPFVQSSATVGMTLNQIRDYIAVFYNQKTACAVASTANLTLVAEQTIDGVLTSASRVLVKNQTLPAANGIYVTGVMYTRKCTQKKQKKEKFHFQDL